MKISDIVNKCTAKTIRVFKFPSNYYKAKTFLERVEELKKEENDFVIILLPGIGDSAYGLSYVESLKSQYCNSRVMAIGNGRLKGFIESYPCVDEFISYDELKGDYRAFFSCERIKILSGHNHVFNTDPYQKRNLGKEPVNAFLRDKVFHLEENSHITYPNIKKVHIGSIDNFDEDCKKIVIINPYSNSVSNIDRATYEDMAALLIKQGKIPYTNLLKGQEGIRGSRDLYCSVEEFATIAERVAGVVSVRSGILDLIVDTGVSIFAIYSNCTTKFRNMYNLTAWRGKSTVSEIDFDGIDRNVFMEKFATWIKSI